MLNWFLRFKISKFWIIGLLVLGWLVLIGVVVFKIETIKKFFEPKPGSCLILTEKNCKKVKIIESNGGKIAVADLPKGSILFSPIDGRFNNNLEFSIKNDLKDFGLYLIDPSLGINTEIYSFVFPKEINFEIKSDEENMIKKGVQVGKIFGIKLNNFGDYNLVFYISKMKTDNSGFVSMDDLLLKMFNK